MRSPPQLCWQLTRKEIGVVQAFPSPFPLPRPIRTLRKPRVLGVATLVGAVLGLDTIPELPRDLNMI